MLKPGKNRVDYGKLLAPREGYVLSMAVGTTYTLDLEALIGIPMALCFASSININKKERLSLFESLRRSTESMKIYCQKGKIKVPTNQYNLFSLLEKSVAQVLPQKKASFHPKVWVIRYEGIRDKRDIYYKVIVLSRNLTFDRSWDVSVALDGFITKEKQSENKILCEFVKYLKKKEDFKDSLKFIRDLEKVKFDIEDSVYDEFEFIPVGIGAISSEKKILDEDCKSTLVISPFLSDNIVAQVKRKSEEIKLFSRKIELDKISSETLKGINSYNLIDTIVNGEEMLELGENEIERSQDLHAKVYVKEKGRRTDLYIGSSNCSNNAFRRNIEFMIRLSATNKYLNTKIIFESLIDKDEKEEYFEEYERRNIKTIDADDEIDRMIEEALRNISAANFSGRVIKEKNEEKYSVEINIGNICMKSGFKYEIRPLTQKGNLKEVSEKIVFNDILQEEITSFYVFIVKFKEKKKECVIKIDITEIPEEREKEIIKSIITSKDGFLNYVNLILGDGDLLSLIESRENEDGEDGEGINVGGIDNSIIKKEMFEKMLRASARETYKLKYIENVLEYFDDEEIVPKDFLDLFEVFRKFS